MSIIKESIKLEIRCPYSYSADLRTNKTWQIIIKGDTEDGGFFKVEATHYTLVKALEDLHYKVTSRAYALGDGIRLLSSLGYDDLNDVKQNVMAHHENWEACRRYLERSID